MSVLAPEREQVQEQVVIKIEQNPVQDALDGMIGHVRMGLWCRNNHRDENDRRCALGLIHKFGIFGR